MSLILGVDGGNSKAIALVARRDGSIIGAARRPGSADIYAGEEAALELLRGVVVDALGEAGATPADVEAATFSLAGADWPEDIEFLRTSLGRMGLGADPNVVNDAVGALVGAVPDGPAVAVTLGTGAATGARAMDGRIWHSSFWQVTQGAVELAQRAVMSLARSDLGIEPAQVLRDRILDAIGEATSEAAIHRLTRRERGSSDTVGAVVRALFAAAEAGDPAAERIVVSHGTQIGELGAAAARRVGIGDGPYSLAFCGGVTRGGAPLLIAAAVDAIRAAGQSPRLVDARWEPAVGALLIHLGSTSGGDELAAVTARLEATMPSGRLFDSGA